MSKAGSRILQSAREALAFTQGQGKGFVLIDGETAAVTYDPESQTYRGEFSGLTGGGAEFYAKSIDDLAEEGRKSLAVFQKMLSEQDSDA